MRQPSGAMRLPAVRLICAVLAPFMGTLGDFKGMKKKLFTTFFMLLGIISSALSGVHWKLEGASGAVCAWHTAGSTVRACIMTAFCSM